MTREEAINILTYHKSNVPENSLITNALDMAVKALEGCEDCISRQAVNTLVDELAGAISDERCCMSRGRATSSIMQDILDLPSVTPKQKMGYWITKPNLNPKCSECGKEPYYSNTIYNYKFCPYCGQPKMTECSVYKFCHNKAEIEE